MMRSYASIFTICTVLFVGIGSTVPADSHLPHAELNRLLPMLENEKIEELLKTGELSAMIDPSKGLTLVPDKRFSSLIQEDLESREYTIGVEVLNIIPGEHDDFDMVTAANNLLELSTLEGLEYYSASREQMRTLFVQSYAIDTAESANRIVDPSIDELPAEGNVVMFQEDMTFGKNVLEIQYTVTQATIHMVTKNITTFSWGPIPLIRPDRLRLNVVVYKTENFILYYGNFGAKAIKLRILNKRIYNSFYNRLMALYGWFEQKL